MSTLTSTRKPEEVDARSFPDAVKVLSDCCTDRTICRFELVHNAFSTTAVFLKLHPQGVELRISADDSEESILEQAICSVTFSVGPTIYAFLGHLIDIRLNAARERRVFVSIPNRLIATNLRQSFRVPVITESGLQVRVRTAEGQKYFVVANDIADAGVEIEFESGDCPPPPVETKLEVELRFRGETVKRQAVIRRVAGPKCGLAFGSLADEPDRQQAGRLNGIVISLQQLWLKNRIK